MRADFYIQLPVRKLVDLLFDLIHLSKVVKI